jgi:DNA polymerase-3 subunit gamma/tau
MTTEREAPHQALYRKWRPQRFADVVDQRYTVQTLVNAISRGEIAHAYLFSGPRGTGKTSVARIFAKAINCPNQKDGEPCNACPGCKRITRGSALDVIEIDGASNRGIDQIRQLREEVNFAPAESRYKVYIIDEVHMLTNEAFNALLKTLEEPPAHVIFVFATTEPHKVPATVLSRCQAFEFKTIPEEQIEKHLREIARAEKIRMDEEALSAIARHARGALRDALVLVEQLVSYKGREAITAQDLYDMLGLPPTETIDRFLSALITRDGVEALRTIEELAERGRDLELFLDEAVHRSRDHLIRSLQGSEVQIPGSPEDWIGLTGRLLELKREMRYALDKRILLEVKALEIARVPTLEPPAVSAPKSAEKTSESSAAKAASGRESETEPPARPKRTEKQPPAEEPLSEPAAKAPKPVAAPDRWPTLLRRARCEKPALYALLAEASARSEADALVIEYPEDFTFHKERLEQPENLQIIEALVREIYGDVRLTIGFAASSAPPRADEPASGSGVEAEAEGDDLREKAELVRRVFDGEIQR